MPKFARKPSRRRRTVLALTSLGFAGFLAGLLAGCGSSPVAPLTSSPANPYAAVAGNWQFTSGPAVRFAGSLAVQGSTVTGKLHPVGMSCASTAVFPVQGTVSAQQTLSLASASFGGGTLAIHGTLAPDQHSLLLPAVTLTGGSCASVASAHALRPEDNTGSTGQQYQPITGAYAGTFTDSDGASQPVDATLSQPTAPDSNGVYHLTGSATFANNPCLSNPVITDSTVSGSQISATYTDSTTGSQIVGTGTFSSDASTLTINNWVLSGSCDADTGTGLLTRH